MSDPYLDGPAPPEPSASEPHGFSWSVGQAVAVFIALIISTLAVGFAAAGIDSLDLADAPQTLVLGGALIASYSFVVLLSWWLARKGGVSLREAADIAPASVRTLVVASLFAILAGRLAAGVWGALIQYFGLDVPGIDLDPSKLFPTGPLGVVMLTVIAVVAAPITEEIVFRGIMLPALEPRLGAASALGISSALFALLHLTAATIPPIFILGMVLGALRLRTGSTTVPIVAHAAFNASGIILLYAAKAAGAL